MFWNNKAFVKPEDITEKNAAEVMRNHIFMASMNPQIDNYGLCLVSAMRFGIEALEREARRQADDKKEEAATDV